MTRPAAAPSAPVASADPVEGFARRIRAANPFAVNRVARLSDANVDVGAIHRGPYEKIVALARQACQSNRAIGAVLWGEAGAGKSHLLSRLAGWAAKDRNANFIYLHNPLVAPEQMPRYVLKCLVSNLTHDPAEHCTLFRLVNAAVREALTHDGAKNGSWRTIQASYNRLVDRSAGGDAAWAARIDRDVYRVLFLFYRSAHASRPKADNGLAPLAVRWLSGDALDSKEAARLGLRADRGEEGARLADDEQVKQVVVALTQLAVCRRQPFLLCFDQAENLGDDRAKALSQFLHDLLDHAGNLLVVLCGVKHDLMELRRTHVIHEAAWDRLTQYRLDLLRIGPDEGRRILEARLAKFIGPFATAPEIKKALSQDSLFPLGAAWYEERAKGVQETQPRRVIDWARKRWEQQVERLSAEPAAAWLKSWDQWGPPTAPPPREPAIDALVDAKIAERIDRHKQEPHALPASAENLSGLVYSLLQQCQNRPAQYALSALVKPPAPKRNMRPPYDFEVRTARPDGESGVGVLFVSVGSATSAAAYLRRLFQETAPGRPDRLLLVGEERQPIPLAQKGNEYLARLVARGPAAFSQTTLTFERYAALDALQAVVDLARSGDLEVEAGPGESRTVSAEEVVASHHRRDRYRVQALLRELLDGPAAASEDPPPPATPPAPAASAPLDEKDLCEFIMGRLSFIVGASSHEVAQWYDQFRGGKNLAPLTVSACKTAVEEAAWKLHAEGKIQATPSPDGLYLLWK